MKVKSNATFSITINQNESSKGYSYGRLQVFSLDNNQKPNGYFGGSCGGKRGDFDYEIDLPFGNYMIVAEMEWATLGR